MRKILTLVLAAGLFAALPPTFSQSPRTGRDLAPVPRALDPLREGRDLLLLPKQDGCEAHFISCGETVTDRITLDDCRYLPPDDDVRYDIWAFEGNAGQTVTMTLSSNDFDPFLQFYDPDGEVVETDDNDGGGFTARIVYTLDRTSDIWSLDATPAEPNVTGTYTLSLQCSGGGPPPPPPPQCPTGFFPDPEYPDFCFDVAITPSGQAPIDGSREASCIEDTVCVSGALAGRSEVFIRILGPRPNGFLWPTITRFTPSRVDVDIVQLSSGDFQSYTLNAVPPGSDDLSGLQDRTGFLP